jgi:succinate dehydrogenase / fumarate reductase, iron-sulfur subunit
MLKFSIYRYNPEQENAKSFMQEYNLNKSLLKGNMLLDALLAIQEHIDPSLAFRKSCREGTCGADGININGQNNLACTMPLSNLEGQTIVLRPLPGMPIIKDLIVDMSNFFKQYEKIQPYLQNNTTPPPTERLQSIEQREKLDGLYECILCACCSSACPVYWSNSEDFLGPAAALQSARFVMDSRDLKTTDRLSQINDPYSVFGCRNIMSCVESCPKGLDPSKAIDIIRKKIIEQESEQEESE